MSKFLQICYLFLCIEMHITPGFVVVGYFGTTSILEMCQTVFKVHMTDCA